MFCAPLFVNLGGTDVRSDEAIYSFAVDRVLETGDWLVPKASPAEDLAFLEKPPLKFWITAAPIRAGLLPLNEFSLRISDAIFGAGAFVYVFLLGAELVAPVAGAIAVLVLFTYTPLLFDHGLRTNGMDSSLVLAYAGGVYHYFRWMNPARGDRAWRHAAAVGAYVTLGLMTKFVAIAFLPLTLAAGTMLFDVQRRRLLTGWRVWTVVMAGVVLLSAPWFIYMRWQFGSYFWFSLLRQQVYTRFTSSLDPGHVQPWNFYWRAVYSSFFYSRSVILVLAGTIVLAFESVKRRWFEGTTVVLWFVLPAALLSLGTSKLIHYVHPFVLALALAAGYLATLILWLGPVLLDKVVRRPPFFARVVFLVLAVLAVALAVDSGLHGDVRWQFTSALSIRNSGVLRPLVIGILCAAVGLMARPGRVVAACIVALLLPLPAYVMTMHDLQVEHHPMRDARDCLLRLESREPGTAPAGLYVDIPPEHMGHPIYYYFRRVRPWTRPANGGSFNRELDGPVPTPVLVWDEHYRQSPRPDVAAAQFDDFRLLLPGPYAACAEDVARTAALH